MRNGGRRQCELTGLLGDVMNRIYKTVWNEQSRTFVAVSENTKARGKRSGQSTGRLAIASIVLAGVGLAGFSVTSTAADDAITFNADTGSTDVSLGQAVTISGTPNNVVTAITGNTVQITLAQDIDLGSAGSLTIGNSMLNNSGLTVGSSALTSNGLAITGGPSVTADGIDAAGKPITNVAAGSAGTDAVNKSQLDTAIGGTYKGWSVQANGDAATPVASNGTVQFKNGQNIAITRSGTDLTISTVSTPTFQGASMAGQKVTNVAAGTVSSSSTDAVNGGQLYTLQDNLSTLQNNLYTQGTGIKYFHVKSTQADS